MFSWLVMRCRFSVSGVNLMLFSVVVLTTLIPSVRADDEAQKARRMLNDLKQRSAAERWQRVKKQYPVDVPVPHRSMPAPLPEDQQKPNADELPPLPTEGYSIPRLTALPADDSTDWIRPARPIEFDDTPSSTKTTKVADASAVQPPIERREESGTSKLSDELRQSTNETTAGRTPRTPLERMISSIDPYYDRDRDSDIRSFAQEKAKEFNIEFKTSGYEQRSFPEITLAWEPTNFYYYPLYFSDPALERYGHSYPRVIQPLASIARFGTQVVFLPYQMAITPPCKPEYPLGFYRPGEYAPKLHYPIPLNAHAAITEAAVVTGLFFIIP